MNLVGFVIAGQHVHHDVDAGAVGIFTLRFIRGHCRQDRDPVGIDGPGAGKIITGDEDRRNAIGRRCRFFARLATALTCLDP